MTAALSRRAHLSPRAALAAGALMATVALPGLLPGLAGAAPAHKTALRSLPPARVVARATADVRRAKAVVLVGRVRRARSTLAFHIASSAHGAAAKGDLVSHSARIGFVGRLDFVERKGAVYLRAGTPFWRAQLSKKGVAFPAAKRGRLAHVLADRWVELSGRTARRMRASLGPLTSPTAFVRTLVSAKSLGHLHRGRPTTFRHHRVLSFRSSRGGVLYVSAKGAPRLLGLVARARAGTGTIVLAYPRAVAVRQPPRARALGRLVASVR